ncbi:MAG: hypothetical protein NTW21_02635 [Verrucomicrobia bacterium]|nr:hypothetical protein [Verrucomicrobiota bacterium]
MSKLTAITFFALLLAPLAAPGMAAECENMAPLRLSNSLPPEVACWFWGEADFKPGGYKEKLDFFGQHTSFTLLTASFRAGRREPLTDPAVFEQVKQAVVYARSKGIGIAPEFSMWSDLTGFLRAYPDELCYVVSLQPIQMAEGGRNEVVIASQAFSGCPSLNYEPGGRPDVKLPPARLLRAYSYELAGGVIKAGSLADVSPLCRQSVAPDGSLTVRVEWVPSLLGKTVVVLGASPGCLAEIFAPHYNEFQEKILARYAGVGLAGACKDEGGDPAVGLEKLPWSNYRQEAYRKATGGRDLLADFLLMRTGEQGREAERQLAINHHLELVRRQNADVEAAFYHLVKKCLGPKAFVGTHPTWISDPNNQGEYQRSGLDWWAVKRDIAQTDEEIPFCVGTALSKKWGSPFWLNMYYSENVEAYRQRLWKYAASGGRMNFHPIWPAPNMPTGDYSLHKSALMRGQQRIRLLNLISKSPLDCPVAVVFGHAATMNYAGPHFQDSGSRLADAFWAAGFPADLIPSSEVEDGSLKVDSDGYVRYGEQRYAAVILYHPEFEKMADADFWQRAARGKSALYRMGNWARDFDAMPVEGDKLLPAGMTLAADAGSCVAEVVRDLKGRGIEMQQAGKLDGHCRLLDGTRIFISADKTMEGDPLRKTTVIGNTKIAFDAEGLVAVRLDSNGLPVALAAGGVRSFTVAEMKITSGTPYDFALWKDDSGHWHGVLQGWNGPVPDDLKRITADWQRLAVSGPGQSAGSPRIDSAALRLPANIPPVLGAWFPQESEMRPDGYQNYLDAMAEHSHYNLLTTTMRNGGRQMIDPAVHDWFKQAAIYARQKGIGLVLELDVRHSIPAFKNRYPDELQERLWLQEFTLPESGVMLTDVSYPCGHGDAICGAGAIAIRLERAYSYTKTATGIDPDTVTDITASCKTPKTEPRSFSAALSCGPGIKERKVCIIARVTCEYPAVFGPHLIPFEEETIRQYADLPLAGLMKDEWGFPACHDGNPGKNGFWFSRWQADAYAKATGGRDMVRDSLLMCYGERGREGQRQAAVNHVMELHRLRNTEIEQAFYRATKATFGPGAFVGTHDTVIPYPDPREFERNGLNWWTATRSYAQSDETTPFCCRTSMAKKFGAPWYNQWYAPTPESYEKLIWSYALAGGRMNFHVLWGGEGPAAELGKKLLRSPVIRADCRIRLLNFISAAPVECPVAVIFGHAGAMNWAGPAYDDVGMELTDAFWRAGYYADLIPSSELRDQALRVDAEGDIWFGQQRYAAVVLYHPEFENATTADFFQKAAKGKTIIYRIGDWTKNFDAKAFDGNAALPARMKVARDINACAEAVLAELRHTGIEPQTCATVTLPRWGSLGRTSAALPSSGLCRLTDGTVILASGQNDVRGDPIQKTLSVDGHDVAIDAVGVAAVRLDKGGKLEALAAGALKWFRGGGFAIDLPERVDVALWRDAEGKWHGVMQDFNGPVPAELLAFTQDWLRLRVPQPLEP